MAISKVEAAKLLGLNLAKDPVKDRLYRFNSVAELIDATEQVQMAQGDMELWGRERGDWYENLSFADVAARARAGDPSLVPKAQELLSKVIDASIETPRREWVGGPTGAYPVVPEALAGSPTPMRRVVDRYADHAPIAVYVGVSSSQGYGTTKLLPRGIAITALVMKLQSIRPVDLYLVATLDNGVAGSAYHPASNYVTVTRVETRPIDLSVAAFVLSSTGFDRRVHIDTGRMVSNFQGGWAACFNSGTIPAFIGMEPHDLFINTAHLEDKLLWQDPPEWVNRQIRKAMQRSENEREE